VSSMFAASNVSIREKVVLAAGASLLAVLCACATARSPQPSAAAESALISELQVESRGDATVVSLLGLAEPEYHAFQQQDPARIVVDLARVRPGEISESIAVYDGTVEEVSVALSQDASGQELTRVELSLARAASYQVVALEERLEIRIAPETEFEVASDGDVLGASSGASELAVEASEIEMPASEGPPSPSEAAAPATALLDVSASSDGKGVVIELLADGRIGNASQFLLQDPPRLVVDLPALVSKAKSAELAVQSSEVSRVRVGQHADKVRVVVDGGAEPRGFEAAQLVPLSTGLRVVIGSDERIAVAETAGEGKATQPSAEKTGALQVYGVQFDAQESADRVVILSDAVAAYHVSEPDPDTVMVQIEGASIDPEAAVRIAPQQPGPVSLVTAFAQPEAGKPEVRVVIRRAAGLDPRVEQQGTMIFLDFPRGGQLAAGMPMLEGVDSPSAAEVAEGEDAASRASAKAVAQAETEVASEVPAAINPEAGSADILEEGGLIHGKQYTGRRISLDFKDVDVDDVLRLIAEVSELNIIAGDEVTGKVTIRLVDVPWDQALDVILLTKGLGFVRVGSVLRIAPAEQLAAEEEARLQERRAKEKLEDLVVKLQPVNYADVKETAKMVKRLLTSRGTVDIDVRTNTIILKDIPSVISEATALVKAIDTQTPQVLIEAKIVEANLDFSRELGSVWGFGIQPYEDAFDDASPVARDRGGEDFRFHPANQLSSINPITSLATGLIDVGAFLLDEKLNLDLQLQAAESSGEGKVISSPRVVTLDNREASIEQGVSIPFQTFENGDAKLEFIDAVLLLEVTPHITADRSIIMKIQVKRNAPDDSVETPTGSPAIAKNEAETETLVKDGQTLVIGGIYTIKKSNRQSRVPYLHKVPILGYAFKKNEVRDTRQELLVFVTPRIVVTTEVGA